MHKTPLSMLAVTAAISVMTFAVSAAPQTVTVKLRVLETSDLHSNIMDYNYYTASQDPSIGLVRTASLIEAARQDAVNTVLVDNGDLIQGSPMGDYAADKGLAGGEVHPVYQAMNLLQYDVGNIGNHEFNYGLDFLQKALAGAAFPYINANVYCAEPQCWNGIKQGEHLFTPYLIKDTEVTDTTGNKHSIKIGYIGFVPPQIMLWDKQHLSGKVRADGIVETALKLVPQMKAQGADLVIAIPHSGIGSSENPGDPRAENAVHAITQVPGIDAVMFGHSHSVFPSSSYSDLPGADIEKGSLNGIPAVMPGRWGDNMGQVDFTLSLQNGKWQVTDATAKSVPIYDGVQKAPLVDADTLIHQAVEEAHLGTIDYMQRPIGVASADMYSFLALVQDDPTVQIVANAQIAKVTEMLPAELQHLPVLSAASPFKAGGRRSSPTDSQQYIQVSAGTLSFRNAADLYLFPNTIVAVKLNGAELKDWLECSANQFNQIDVNSSAPQQLINDEHPTYNFDVIDGVSYQIDITQPAKFDRNCELQDATTSRIVQLSYTDATGKKFSGKALAEKQFIVATNNYRAFGDSFAGTGNEHVVMELPDSNREALVSYIQQLSGYDAATGEYLSQVNPVADNNWQLQPITGSVPLDIRFSTQDSKIAEDFVRQYKQWPMTKLGTDELGFAEYRIELQ
ncbi:bifunctional 2',3'-cyclic-nucleotide 2'-phosphodiesterase/3'-nucleotidase [Methylophaga sp.]|uniref:bifunctional 2',3'-cyclic-nucleotide 2'-phosphodiesterase/3'-nucleotidase n=1 Tax=Methylophaga sp. TaxID=2024840 RepID=UPI002717DF59|nr:bifunctional 2',3'-cyclic-nucleotide 2'-phosphodiesterase/3'-nucleotidase [Methylophaga sp.]MDO8826180.1 bifunctional 2',3'-cyclic-nucleotide 2'-phosphodiesterase/3'-nucleotidase [Methylophaga sp.]